LAKTFLAGRAIFGLSVILILSPEVTAICSYSSALDTRPVFLQNQPKIVFVFPSFVFAHPFTFDSKTIYCRFARAGDC
jgi:hypothetical protein